MLKNCLAFCLFFVCFGQIYGVLNPKVICYYDNWLVWRTDESKITVTDVDSSLCTHIVYGYLGVTSASQIYIDDPELLINKHDLENFSKNKGRAQALLAVGGWGYSLDPAKEAYWVRNMLKSPSAFVSDVMSFLTKFGFDGITIDWSRDTWDETEMKQFVDLLKDLRRQFGTKYTIGVTLGAETVRYDIKGVNDQVDFITVQTIDYHGNWETVTGYGAPINLQLRTLDKWWQQGADETKLIMTIPFYAHTWILKDPLKKDIGAEAKGPGREGPWSKAPGKLGYNEICTGIKASPATWDIHRDTVNESIYAVHVDTWISYEDPVTVAEKANTSTSLGYGGVTVQALENDDFRNLCGQGKWPLLTAVNKGLNKDPIAHRTTTTQAPVTRDPTQICQHEGTVKDPQDCHAYHVCIEYFPGVYSDEKKMCGSGEGFDEKSGKCVDQSQIPGCH